MGKDRGKKNGNASSDKKVGNMSPLKTGTWRSIIAVLAIAAIIAGTILVGGLPNGRQSSTQTWKKLGTVAARVGDKDIMEDDITEQIMQYRSSYEDDASWANYLTTSAVTPQDLRDYYIQQAIDNAIMEIAAEENGVSISEDDIKAQIAEDVEASGFDNEKDFYSYIEGFGYTEDAYKASLNSYLLRENLVNKIAPIKEATDEDIIAYLDENKDMFTKTYKTSHILIEKQSTDGTAGSEENQSNDENKAKAESILSEIESGDLTFDEAVEKYKGEDYVLEAGDVGWDYQNMFVEEYQNAMAGMKKGDVSDVVETSYGYHIIYCTDVFEYKPGTTKASEVPQDISASIKSEIETKTQNEKYNAWFEEYKAGKEGDIEIMEMPDGLPYMVDMSLATIDANGNPLDAAETDGSGQQAEDAAQVDEAESQETEGEDVSE